MDCIRGIDQQRLDRRVKRFRDDQLRHGRHKRYVARRQVCANVSDTAQKRHRRKGRLAARQGLCPLER